MNRLKLGLCLWVGCASLATGLATGASAIAAVSAERPVAIDIEAGPLDAALQSFAAQTHQQLLYTAAIAAGRKVEALKGAYTPEQALQRLLRGTDIEVFRPRANVLVLRPKVAAIPAAYRSADDASPIDIQINPDLLGGQGTQTQASAAGPATTLAEVVVTGSHIRGVKDSASPVKTITQEQIREQGDATVADMLDRLPQNFGGSATPNTSFAGTDPLGTNAGESQGVNLRGLGPAATLVLIDGRRVAGSGLQGDFADVSSIPTEAVDHVDVLLDGASAIYGSDAVGGVVNVVMKTDFEGAETRLRYGVDSGGVGSSEQVSQAFGSTWSGGHFLLTYEHQHDDALPAASRAYTANTDLRTLGGTNHDLIYSDPGNLLAYNAAAGAFAPTYAIVPGTNGPSFVAGQANLMNYRAGTDLTPSQARDAVFVSASQDFGDATTVSLEGRASRRQFSGNSPAVTSILQVTPANPYYVSPSASPYELIGYSFAGDLGPQQNNGTVDSFDVTAGLDQKLWHGWKLSTYAAFADQTEHIYNPGLPNDAYLQEALGNAPVAAGTSYNPAVDGYFNPYGTTSKSVLAYVGGGFDNTVDVSQVTTLNAQLDGTVVSLPSGDLKAAFGAQFRHERFESTLVDFTEATSTSLSGGPPSERDVSSVFGELNIPLVGPDNAVPGVRKLVLSLAGRVEHYDDFGTTSNPKLGLVWRPIDDLNLRATYGTSFRAPDLTQLTEAQVNAPAFLTRNGVQTLVLMEYGGDASLKPETATTWTAGFDWTPKAFKGLRVGATWFDIDFSNQIGRPALENQSQVLSNPAYASFVTVLNGSSAADLAKIQALLNQSITVEGSAYPASAYGAIVDARFVNAASVLVRGLDAEISQGFSLWRNSFNLSADTTYLADYQRRLTPTATPEQLVSTAGEPVDFKGRFSGSWSRGPYGATFTVNFTDSYRDPVADRTIGSWTTCDLQLRWRSPSTSGPAKGLELALSAQNLFDKDPPFYDSPSGVGYDPANATPFGRVVSASLAKRW